MSETIQERIDRLKVFPKGITRDDGDAFMVEIDTLRAELERVKAENEWHKYPDEKPEVDEVIDVIRQSAIRAAKFFDYFDAKGESSPRFATPVERVVMDDVMLWRSPLPAAPEEGE